MRSLNASFKSMTFIFCSSALVPTAHAQSIRDISPSNNYDTRPLAVSADGEVVAGSFQGSGFSGSRSFVWTKSTGFLDLGIPHSGNSIGVSGGIALSSDGNVIAATDDSTSIGYTWTASAGQLQLTGGLGYSTPLAASGTGEVVVGYSWSNTQFPHAWMWNLPAGLPPSDQRLEVGLLTEEAHSVSDDAKRIAGLVQVSGSTGGVACIWDVNADGTLSRTNITGTGGGHRVAISADGQVVAGTEPYPGTGTGRAYRWTGSGGVSYLNSSGLDGSVYGISGDGSVVVGRHAFVNPATGGIYYSAFMWRSDVGVVDLDQYLASIGIDMSDWNLEYAFSVSGDGLTIVGMGTNSQGIGQYHGFLVTLPCPGPDASWANYGAGLPGTLGVPSLTCNLDPVLGTTISVDIGNSFGAPTVGLLLAGLGRASLPMKGGLLLVGSIFASYTLPIDTTGAQFDSEIPDDPTLCGVIVDAQVLQLDSGAVRGLSFTPGLELLLGS